MKQPVYFIPGMWSSSKIYERIHLPKDTYQSYFLEWITPLHKNESLDSYILRYTKQITHPNPIFIGVSFGGIIAQELAIRFNNTKVIIISSIKNKEELSPFYQFCYQYKLHKLFPITIFKKLEELSFKYSSPKTKRTLLSYRKFLPLRDVVYTKWAIQTFLKWVPSQKITVIHLHGDNDSIISIKHIKNCIKIKEGTHAMILSKSNTIQTEILKHLK